MDWLTNLWNYIKVKVTGVSMPAPAGHVKTAPKPIFKGAAKVQIPNEIVMGADISDQQIERSKYIKVVKNPPYRIKSGDNLESIAKKFHVEVCSIMALNGLDAEKAKKIRPGQTLKMPPSRKIRNVKNLNDVAKSMGVSLDFVKKLKRVEDNGELGANEFHLTPYKDKAGVLTIGIGHVLKPGDPREITKEKVAELCASDLLKMEENISVLLGGKKNFEKLPQPMKEALLDMVFNKGTAIIEKTPGLLYCLKAGKYEAAINKFTNNKSSKTGKEMSGLSKRRLFDISLAVKMYNGKIPQSNINTAQQVYNRGIELLRAECKKDGKNFQNQLAGYNKDVQSYLGNKIKLITK